MENRTPDLVIANDALYQLSYDPTRRVLPTIPVAVAQGQSYFLILNTLPLGFASISSKYSESCFPKMSIWNSWDLYAGLEARTAIGGDSEKTK